MFVECTKTCLEYSLIGSNANRNDKNKLLILGFLIAVVGSMTSIVGTIRI